MFMMSWKKLSCDRVMRGNCIALIFTENTSIKAPTTIAVYERKSPDGTGKVIGSFYVPEIYEWVIDSNTNAALSQITGIHEDVIDQLFNDGTVIYVWFIMNKKLYYEPKSLAEFTRNQAPITRPPIRYMEVDDFND